MSRWGKDLKYWKDVGDVGGEFQDFLNALDECLSELGYASTERGLRSRLDECLRPGWEVQIIPDGQTTLTDMIGGKVPRILLVLCTSRNFGERVLEALRSIHARRVGRRPNFKYILFLAVSWSVKNEYHLMNFRKVVRDMYGIRNVCVKTPAIRGAPVRCQ